MTREEREMDVWQRAYDGAWAGESRAGTAEAALKAFRDAFPEPDAAHQMIAAARLAAIEAYNATNEDDCLNGILKVMAALECGIPVNFAPPRQA